jgi:hypothetical protein
MEHVFGADRCGTRDKLTLMLLVAETACVVVVRLSMQEKAGGKPSQADCWTGRCQREQ